MRSAQRQKRLKTKAFGKKLGFFVKLLFVPVIFLLSFLFIHFSTRYWNGHDKFAFVFQKNSGGVGVTVADPKTNEITTLLIPGDTEVEVAENYGTLRLKNVWQLGVNEKKEGILVAKTIMRNFYFPVFLWVNRDGDTLSSGNFLKIIRFILFPDKTNIPFGDRVALSLFSLKTKSIDRVEIDLAKSQFLTKATLSDGNSGYRVSEITLGRLSALFSDNDFSESDLRVSIVDSTNSPRTASNVGKIVEVMGGKVVSINRVSGVDFSCEVTGKNKVVIAKFANIFACKTNIGKTDFDVEIKLGALFNKNF